MWSSLVGLVAVGKGKGCLPTLLLYATAPKMQMLYFNFNNIMRFFQMMALF